MQQEARQTTPQELYTRHHVSGSKWSFLLVPEGVQEILPNWAVTQAYHMVNDEWRCMFPAEHDTWVWRTHRVPSLFVRIEGMIRAERRSWDVCEFDERPAGISVCADINPLFAAQLNDVRRHWPQFAWVESPARKHGGGNDDEGWLGPALSYEEARASDQPLLVRARPEEHAYHTFATRSVSSVRNEGDKTYGEQGRMNLWRTIEWISEWGHDQDGYMSPTLDNLPKRFVVKPKQGTRTRGVRFFAEGKNRLPGTSRRDYDKLSDIEKTLKEFGAMYCQELHEPMRFPWAPDMHGLCRLYFAYDPSRGRYRPIGGVANAAPKLLIHGDENAVMCPLVHEIDQW